MSKPHKKSKRSYRKKKARRMKQHAEEHAKETISSDALKMRDAYGDQVSFTKDEIEEMKLDDGLAIDWDKATIEEDK